MTTPTTQATPPAALSEAPIGLEVARANAAYYTARYLDHHESCPIAPLRRCEECERRAQDMVASVRHKERIEAREIHGASLTGRGYAEAESAGAPSSVTAPDSMGRASTEPAPSATPTPAPRIADALGLRGAR